MISNRLRYSAVYLSGSILWASIFWRRVYICAGTAIFQNSFTFRSTVQSRCSYKVIGESRVDFRATPGIGFLPDRLTSHAVWMLRCRQAQRRALNRTTSVRSPSRLVAIQRRDNGGSCISAAERSSRPLHFIYDSTVEPHDCNIKYAVPNCNAASVERHFVRMDSRRVTWRRVRDDDADDPFVTSCRRHWINGTHGVSSSNWNNVGESCSLFFLTVKLHTQLLSPSEDDIDDDATKTTIDSRSSELSTCMRMS